MGVGLACPILCPDGGDDDDDDDDDDVDSDEVELGGVGLSHPILCPNENVSCINNILRK